ncbi:hypothetical protein ANO14919_131220 [Xylariales sp. No.14919]|nr:hypothetical protein ANO14919_131220 [Xylariales sp. No.14919]
MSKDCTTSRTLSTLDGSSISDYELVATHDTKTHHPLDQALVDVR